MLIHDVSYLLYIYFAVHHEALVIKKASNYFHEFNYGDKLTNKVYY
jgi:hypothetical protein